MLHFARGKGFAFIQTHKLLFNESRPLLSSYTLQFKEDKVKPLKEKLNLLARSIHNFVVTGELYLLSIECHAFLILFPRGLEHRGFKFSVFPLL